MKIIITAMILMLFVSCNQQKETSGKSLSKNSSKTEKDTLSPDKILQTPDEIKKEFTIINEKLLSKQLDSASFTYTCEETEGKADFYNEKQRLRMVKHFYADSHFSSVTNYYVKNNSVFFIFKEETVWQFDGGTAEKPITKDSISQQRIYLRNGSPIQCLEKNFTLRSAGKNVDPETVPNRKGNCDVKELMDIYQKILKNKDRKNKTLCL
ncbi:hypothetical protein [Chryseobacterium hagamense]|uniref:Lipoprotein n=1 Tax=Chryseobacterium hagamense TaxID=395935 RepID=A0A511YGX9_9FLAO|nr:hypothetical protein [Chryseobacterium hagamense]GEN74467.1 hypothetical protein CHA01nite_02070 [Chryseobacterium hagamense]